MLAQLHEEYPDDLRIVYRHFPLIQIHDKAALATQAAEAAGLQNAFWEMHAILFGLQTDWKDLTPEEFIVWVVDIADQLGLDVTQFETDMLSQEMADFAQANFDWAAETGLGGTPFLLINGLYYDGPRDFSSMNSLMGLFLIERDQYRECPDFTIDTSKTYIATLKTEKGDIVIELFDDIAPYTVNNFVFLAENGWYDNVSFHRVKEGFMAQSGDPTGTGVGNPGYLFGSEISEDLVFDRAGVLAMANSGLNANGSQFFITLGPTPHLNGAHTIFGEVIDGMEVVEAITLRDPSQPGVLPPGDLIYTVIITVQ